MRPPNPFFFSPIPQGMWVYTLSGYVEYEERGRVTRLGAGSVLAVHQPARGTLVYHKKGLPWRRIYIGVTGAAAMELFDYVTHQFGQTYELPSRCKVVQAARALCRLASERSERPAQFWSVEVFKWLNIWWSSCEKQLPKACPSFEDWMRILWNYLRLAEGRLRNSQNAWGIRGPTSRGGSKGSGDATQVKSCGNCGWMRRHDCYGIRLCPSRRSPTKPDSGVARPSASLSKNDSGRRPSVIGISTRESVNAKPDSVVKEKPSGANGTTGSDTMLFRGSGSSDRATFAVNCQRACACDNQCHRVWLGDTGQRDVVDTDNVVRILTPVSATEIFVGYDDRLGGWIKDRQ